MEGRMEGKEGGRGRGRKGKEKRKKLPLETNQPQDGSDIGYSKKTLRQLLYLKNERNMFKYIFKCDYNK